MSRGLFLSFLLFFSKPHIFFLICSALFFYCRCIFLVFMPRSLSSPHLLPHVAFKGSSNPPGKRVLHTAENPDDTCRGPLELASMGTATVIIGPV